MITIMVVEDDESLNQIVSGYLRSKGYGVLSCLRALDSFDIMEQEAVDMVISDIMMPEMDGFELAQTIRRQNSTIPILFMSAREDLPSKQKGYELGIDDYMVKPIELDELLLRITALLRRANIASQKKIQIGELELLEEETTGYFQGEDLGLTVKEFNILFKLLSYPKRTFTRMQLMDEFWGYDTESNPRTVDVSITKIRDKICSCTQIEILTVRGMGYKAVIKG